MKHRSRLVLAVGIACVGLFVAGRSLWRSSSSAIREVASQQSPSQPHPIAEHLEAEFKAAEPVDRDKAIDLAHQIRSAVQDRLLALPANERPSVTDAKLLAEETGEIFAIYLSADFHRYLSFVESRGASIAMLDTPENRTRLEGFFESTVSTVRLRPVSIEEIVVRPRFLRGREIPQASLGRDATVTAPAHYSLPMDASRARLTVYETAVPVSYTWEGETSPMFIAIWHAWSTERSRWLPWRLVMYDPTMKATIVPPPHP
jgi:hypothetical protein